MALGLPKININFQEKGATARTRSGRGVVALILKDDVAEFTSRTYRRMGEVEEGELTPENFEHLASVLKGPPLEVKVEIVGMTDDLQPTLDRLKNERFNYMAMPDADEGEKEEIETFVKRENKENYKTFKAVLANVAVDSELIINFTTENIKVGDRTYSAGEFTSRIVGILAGLSLNRSSTYYVLPEVESIEAIADEDEAINLGELILINDGEKVKIGRGVNSLVTFTEDKKDSFKKIKIVEGVHLMQDDIRRTFEDEYVGKYVNDYDNKVLFLAATNSYLTQLERGYVLDRGYPNLAVIDFDAQKAFIEDVKGVDTLDMEDQAIKEYNTGSSVFVKATVKFVDVMEDLEFNVFM